MLLARLDDDNTPSISGLEVKSRKTTKRMGKPEKKNDGNISVI